MTWIVRTYGDVVDPMHTRREIKCERKFTTKEKAENYRARLKVHSELFEVIVDPRFQKKEKS